MKNLLSIAVLLLLLTSCEFRNIEIKGTAPGWENATVIIRGHNADKPLFAENVVNGKFIIVQQPLKTPGYYTLIISPNGRQSMQMPQHCEVYLEPGKYNIAFNAGKNGYPLITSSSDIQNDLNVYRHFTDSVMHSVSAEYNKWLTKFNDPSAALLPDKEYQTVLNNVKVWQDKLDNASSTTLAAFVVKYPANKVITHMMNSMYMAKNPEKFYAVYQQLDDDLKNTKEGKEIGNKLSALIKLMPGAVAPEIAGQTPDGKKIDVKAMRKKVILVEFWRSGYYSLCRKDHADLVNNLLPRLDATKVGIVGVSFDTDRERWINTIKTDKLSWPQISDLKGDDSPNVTNWNISIIPDYSILDGDGRVLFTNIPYSAVEVSINEYLRKTNQ